MHWDPFWLSISPNGATGTHFSSISIIFSKSLDDHFYGNQFFLKKWISCGSSGKSDKLKMTAYRSSNSEVFNDFHYFFTSKPCNFSQKPLFHFEPYNISSEAICIFLSHFTNSFVLRADAPAGAFLFPKNDT